MPAESSPAPTRRSARAGRATGQCRHAETRTSSGDSPRCTLSGRPPAAAANRTKEIGRNRVRRMRHDDGPQPLARWQRGQTLLPPPATIPTGSAAAEPQQLVEDRRRQFALGQRRRRPRVCCPCRRRAPSHSRAPRQSPRPTACLRCSTPGCAAILGQPFADQPRRPRRHRVARRHASTHPGQLEMRVGVDEAGEDDGSRLAARAFGVRRSAFDGRSAAPTPTIRPRSTSTHPSRIGGASMGRTHAARWTRDISVPPVRRAFFSAALRAG